MSIASRITSMTQHTKEAYDKIASLGADLTGVNKNIDNIADVLDDVYAGYPKVTGSGTSMSISNCKKAGMEIEYKGNTSQTGTPTPTSPIDVNVVKGNNILTVSDGTNSTNYPVNLRGKNLFDYDTIIPTMIVNSDFPSSLSYNASTHTLTMTNPNNDTYLPKLYNQAPFIEGVNVTVKPNTNYIWSFTVDQALTTLKCSIMGVNSSNKYNYISDGFLQNNVLSFNSGNYTQVSFRIGSTATTGTVTHFSNFMLEENSAKTNFEPYWSYELCKIDTYQDKIRKSTGKNLLNKELVDDSWRNVNTTTQLETGVKVTCTEAGAYRWSVILIPNSDNLLGKTVTVKSNIVRSGNNDAQLVLFWANINNKALGSEIKSVTSTSSSMNFTTNIPSSYPSNMNGIVLGVYSTKTVSCSVGDYIEYRDLQLEENSSATEYEPYGKVWYKKNAIGKKVLNGSETNLFYNSDSGETGVGFVSFTTTDMQTGNYNDGLSNYFKNNKSGKSINTIRFGANSKVIYMYVNNTEITSLNVFTTWLSTHNTSIYYILETPTYTIITEQALIDQLEAIKYSMNGTTIITQTNEDKPFELDVKALRGE